MASLIIREWSAVGDEHQALRDSGEPTPPPEVKQIMEIEMPLEKALTIAGLLSGGLGSDGMKYGYEVWMGSGLKLRTTSR